MKSMIFLIDGTGNDATVESFSNVYAINQIIFDSKKAKRGTPASTQVTFYLPGIGTKFTVKRSVRSRGGIFGGIEVVRQQVFGDNLEQIILRAYVDLCANYHLGDDIILIGFSRGAAAARIFSRLISDFGILKAEHLSLLDRLWNEFVEISSENSDSDYFNRIESLLAELLSQGDGEAVFHDSEIVRIKFLGVFDTVIGPLDFELAQNVTLRDHVLAKSVEHAVHLMSLHDVRADFECKRITPRNQQQTLREIWVPGVHSDIGGGYQQDFISNVALLTMALFLESLGKISIDETARRKVISDVRQKARSNQIFINAEPSVRLRRQRSVDLKADDELHPLHKYLFGRQVYWKDYFTTSVYRDFFAKNVGKVHPDLNREFRKWVS